MTVGSPRETWRDEIRFTAGASSKSMNVYLTKLGRCISYMHQHDSSQHGSKGSHFASQSFLGVLRHGGIIIIQSRIVNYTCGMCVSITDIILKVDLSAQRKIKGTLGVTLCSFRVAFIYFF